MQKFFNGYNSCTYIPTQLRAPSLKVSSHADHIHRSESVKVTKNEPKLTIILIIILFRPGIPQNIVKSNFLWVARKASYSVSVGQISALCAIYYTSYTLKPVDRGIKNGQSPGFPDLLTPATLYKYLYSSRIKIKT